MLDDRVDLFYFQIYEQNYEELMTTVNHMQNYQELMTTINLKQNYPELMTIINGS